MKLHSEARATVARTLEVGAWILFACLMTVNARTIWAGLGDTAIFGYVYLWGAEGNFNNVCGPHRSPCAFVNGLAVAQLVGFVSLIAPVILGIATRRSRSAARFASFVLVTLGLMATAQTRALVHDWNQAVIHPIFWIPFAFPFVIVLALAVIGSQPIDGNEATDVSRPKKAP
jgi:hypothetical protein